MVLLLYYVRTITTTKRRIMYSDIKTKPLTVQAYIAELAAEGVDICIDAVKSQMTFYFDFQSMRNSSGINCELHAKEIFQNKMSDFGLDSLICEILSYKGEGSGYGLYFSDDLDHLSD